MVDPTLVVVFLRGGIDGLALVGPTGDKDYVAARPSSLRVERTGDDKGFSLNNGAADVDFRFHPQAKELAELYGAGEMAVVHAAGLRDATRSHFDAEDRMERAAPNAGATSGGWLGRWVKAAQPTGLLPTLAVGSSAPDSFRGGGQVAVSRTLNGLRLAGGHGLQNSIRQMMAQNLGNDPLLGAPLNKLLSLSSAIETKLLLDDEGDLQPYIPSVDYPEDNEFARGLMSIAQTIKLGFGLRVATLNYGGWDTHVGQVDAFPELVHGLSKGLMAFWRDLGPARENVSVVVMSEFGRRLKANDSAGTDHGHGNVMMTLGAGVLGGKMYGRWPGLSNDALDMRADLAITTDYRQVLSEVMAGHMGFSQVDLLFPGFAPDSLGMWRN